MAATASPLPVLVLRPEPGATATCAAATALGLHAVAHPLFAVKPLAWEPVARADFDGLLLGSANALRHGGAAVEAYRDMPAYVVGQTTAQAAQYAGLQVEIVGTGGLQGVLDALSRLPRATALSAAPLRLLRLAGRERMALAVPDAISILTRDVYASEALPASSALLALLREPAVVLLHSGEAAARLASLCTENEVDRGRLALAVIGPRVAERAGDGWRVVNSAEAPNDAALLALAARMCQDLAPRH